MTLNIKNSGVGLGEKSPTQTLSFLHKADQREKGLGGGGVENIGHSMPAPKAGLAILTIMLL